MAHPSYTIHVCYPIARPTMRRIEKPRSVRIIRQGRVRLCDASVFFASMRLFEDRLVFSGWSWQGHYQQEMSLVDLTEVRWVNNPDIPGNLVLVLRSGDMLTLRVNGAGTWKYALDGQCGRRFTSMRFETETPPQFALAA